MGLEIYLPLFYVFISGLGFSIQVLFVKILADDTSFSGSFEIIAARGLTQCITSTVFIHLDSSRNRDSEPVQLFGNTLYVRSIIFTRAIVGYLGIAFGFLSVEYLPIGDATVLMMLSPMIASIAGAVILGEPWLLPEFLATCVSIFGAVLVAKPPFLFGGASSSNSGSGEDPLGVMYALLQSLAAGAAYICVRLLGTSAKMPWANVCFAQGLAQFLLAFPSASLAGQRFVYNLSAQQWMLIWGGGLIGAISQVAMTIGMQREKSAKATVMRMSDVVFSFIWQALFTADSISALSVAGALLVVSSVLIIVASKRQESSSKPSDPLISSSSSSAVDSELLRPRKAGGNRKGIPDDSEEDSVEIILSSSSECDQYNRRRPEVRTNPTAPPATAGEKLASARRIVSARLRQASSLVISIGQKLTARPVQPEAINNDNAIMSKDRNLRDSSKIGDEVCQPMIREAAANPCGPFSPANKYGRLAQREDVELEEKKVDIEDTGV